jgi:hypothetical protein
VSQHAALTDVERGDVQFDDAKRETASLDKHADDSKVLPLQSDRV